MQVAETIRQQLGNRCLYMLGAKHLLGDETSLQFSIQGCKEINKIQIILDPSDTYTMKFWKIRGADFKLVKEVNEVYCDQLHDMIESITGLATSL